MIQQLSRSYRNHLSLRIPAGILLVALCAIPADGIGFSLCPFALLTDIPCPACGLIRSMSSLLHLQPALSLSYHPLGWLILLLIIAGILTNRTDCVASWLFPKDGASDTRHLAWLTGTLFILVWLARLASGLGVPLNS